MVFIDTFFNLILPWLLTLPGRVFNFLFTDLGDLIDNAIEFDLPSWLLDFWILKYSVFDLMIGILCVAALFMEIEYYTCALYIVFAFHSV